LRTVQCSQFAFEGVEVGLHAIVLADGDGEVAVATMMGAERDVDVRGLGPKPRGTVVHGKWIIARC
jgi:hypothetical protein